MEISLYNILDQEVKQFALGNKTAGEHTLSFEALGRNLAAGIYFVRMHIREANGAKRVFSQRLLVQ